MSLEEDTTEHVDEPDTQGSPEVEPGVAQVAKVPEAETEVDDGEEEVGPVEAFVDAVTDPGDGEDDEAEEDGEGGCAGIL